MHDSIPTARDDLATPTECALSARTCHIDLTKRLGDVLDHLRGLRPSAVDPAVARGERAAFVPELASLMARFEVEDA